MRAQRSFDSRWYGFLAIGGLCLVTGLSTPVAVQAADPDKANAGDTKEQTPEEAAGGRMKLMQIKKACEEDIKRLCADIRPGGGRLLQCLRGKPDNLSPACREVMASRAANR